MCRPIRPSSPPLLTTIRRISPSNSSANPGHRTNCEPITKNVAGVAFFSSSMSMMRAVLVNGPSSKVRTKSFSFLRPAPAQSLTNVSDENDNSNCPPGGALFSAPAHETSSHPGRRREHTRLIIPSRRRSRRSSEQSGGVIPLMIPCCDVPNNNLLTSACRVGDRCKWHASGLTVRTWSEVSKVVSSKIFSIKKKYYRNVR
mmetsp:Transcript_41103/g.124175  ORF Transcript_41103/g.124175 Transcript_41103/m.124175 type:complete len:201 (+) Transcript_41103:886-1488(+)